MSAVPDLFILTANHTPDELVDGIIAYEAQHRKSPNCISIMHQDYKKVWSNCYRRYPMSTPMDVEFTVLGVPIKPIKWWELPL